MFKKNQIAHVIVGFLLATSLVYIGSVSGCAGTKLTPNPGGINDGLNYVQGDVKKAADTLQGTTAAIQDSVAKGSEKTPDSIKPILTPFWTTILIKAGVQEAVIADLRANDAKFTQIAQKNVELQKFSEIETARANQAEADKNDEARKRLYQHVTIGAILFAVGVALMFSGYPWGKALGGTIATFAGVLTGLSFVLVQLLNYMPWIMLALGLTAAGALIWYFIKRKKTEKVLVKEKVEVTNKAHQLEAKVTEVEERRLALENKFTKVEQDNVALAKQHNDVLVKAKALLKDRNDFVAKYNSLAHEKTDLLKKTQQAEKVVTETSEKLKKIEKTVTPDLINRTAALEARTKAVEDKTAVLDSRTTIVEKKSVDLVKKTNDIAKKAHELDLRTVSAEKAADQNKSFLEGYLHGVGRPPRDSTWTAHAV